MSALNSKVDAIQGLGNKLSVALRESKKVVESNKFFLSSGNATLAKYGSWAAAGAGIAIGAMLAPAAPLVAAIGFGVSAGVAVIGTAMERIAGEREHLRQEHQQFISQAQDFMKVLQKAYADVKQEIQEEQRTGNVYQNADFVQYQQHRQDQQLGQQQDAGQSFKAPSIEGVANKASSGMRLG